MCRTLISVVKPQHSWVGYSMVPSSFPCHHLYPQMLLKGMPVLHSATAHGVTTSQRLGAKPVSSGKLSLPNTSYWEYGSDPFCRQSQTHQRDTQPGQDPYSSQDLALNPKRILPPSSFHGCNSVIPLCKSGINVLTLLRLFCSNSGLNAVRISLTYVCFQSRAISLWEQQLTPRPTAKIPADGTMAGSAVAKPCPATGTGRWAPPYTCTSACFLCPWSLHGYPPTLTQSMC